MYLISDLIPESFLTQTKKTCVLFQQECIKFAQKIPLFQLQKAIALTYIAQSGLCNAAIFCYILPIKGPFALFYGIGFVLGIFQYRFFKSALARQ